MPPRAAPVAGLEPGERNEEAPPASDLPSDKIFPLPIPGEVQGRDASDVLAALRAAPDGPVPNPSLERSTQKAGLGPVEQAPVAEPSADEPEHMRPLSGTAQSWRRRPAPWVSILFMRWWWRRSKAAWAARTPPGNPNTGLFQLGPSERAKYGKGDGSIASEAALGVRSLVDDQQVADTAVGAHAEGWQAYVVHQQGIGGGPALLQADPNADAATVLVNNTKEWREKGYGAALAELRGNIPQDMRSKVGPNPTVGQFLGVWRDKYTSIKRQFTGAAMPSEVPAAVMDQAGGPGQDQTAGMGASRRPIPSAKATGRTFRRRQQLPMHAAGHHDDFYDRLSGPSGALLMAGLGMMAGKSKFPLVNIGEGGQAGLDWAEHQAQIREQQQMREVQADYNNVYERACWGTRRSGTRSMATSAPGGTPTRRRGTTSPSNSEPTGTRTRPTGTTSPTSLGPTGTTSPVRPSRTGRRRRSELARWQSNGCRTRRRLSGRAVGAAPTGNGRDVGPREAFSGSVWCEDDRQCQRFERSAGGLRWRAEAVAWKQRQGHAAGTSTPSGTSSASGRCAPGRRRSVSAICGPRWSSSANSAAFTASTAGRPACCRRRSRRWGSASRKATRAAARRAVDSLLGRAGVNVSAPLSERDLHRIGCRPHPAEA